jgi:hypothetical protein
MPAWPLGGGAALAKALPSTQPATARGAPLTRYPLRNSVVHDKVTGGYRSGHGAEQGATFATLLTTARKRGENAFERLCAIAGPSPLEAAGPAAGAAIGGV